MSPLRCPRCGAPLLGRPQPYSCHQVVKYRRQTDHRLHALITIVSCFMWLPGWVLVAAWNAWGPEATAYVDQCPHS